MSYDDAFARMKDFFENKPAATLAIKKLKKGEEISLVIDNQMRWALFNDGGQSRLENRPANNPTVEFQLNPEAVRRFETAPGDNMAQFGIEVVKEVVAGHVKIILLGKVWTVMTGGYLGIILEAGPEFAAYLAQHGITNLGKIKGVIKAMKKG